MKFYNAFGVDGEDYQWVDAIFKLHTRVNFKAGIEMKIGFPDWGKWPPGEIFGEQLYFGASDCRVLSLQAGLYPTAATSVRMQYFNVSWLETETVYGAYQVGDKAASDELNLIFEWYPTDAFYPGIIAGTAVPDTGVKTLNGDDETASVLMCFWSYSF